MTPDRKSSTIMFETREWKKKFAQARLNIISSIYHQFSQVSLVLVVLHASLRYLFHRLLFKRSLQVMVCFAFDFFIFPTRFLSTHIASCISTFPTTIYMIKFCERQFARTSLNCKRSAIFFSLVYCTNFVRQSTNTP